MGGLDVAGPVTVEVRPALRQPGHGRQVENDLHVGQQLVQRIMSQIDLVKMVARATEEVRLIAVLDGPRVIGDERIQADHVRAGGQELFTQVGPDKPCGPGDDTFHSPRLQNL